MTLRYEINPPKIDQNSSLSQENMQELLDKVKLRVSEISTLCDGIHFTDSVLGIPRISPITSGTLIRKSNQ
jgi:homocysteine S-methyltransferase